MDAPKCRLCGTKHWGRCPAFGKVSRMHEVLLTAEPKRKPEAVTINPAISVTPVTINPAKRKRGRPKTGKALSDAERARRYRAHQREGTKR
jgi:hypothetical protein